MYSAFLLMIFGLLLVIRTVFLRQQNVSISNFALIILISTIEFLFFQSVAMILVLNVALCALPFFFEVINELQNKKTQTRQSTELLDYLVLQVKAGHSLRSTILGLSNLSQSPLRRSACLILQGNLKSADHVTAESGVPISKECLNVLFGIQQVLKSEHQQLARLLSFRRVLHLTQSVRQKSRRKTSQARAQSLLLAIIYCALILFQFHTGGLSCVSGYFVFSLTSFLLGSWWLWRLERSFRWKI